MQTNQAVAETSGQVGPMCKSEKNNRDTDKLFLIDGCSVLITSSAANSDATVRAVKEILFFAYRTKITNR